jgi:dihydroorotase-like cyclic amidohydrolase
MASLHPTRLLGLPTASIEEGQPAFLTIFRTELDESADAPDGRRFVPESAFIRGIHVDAAT